MRVGHDRTLRAKELSAALEAAPRKSRYSLGRRGPTLRKRRPKLVWVYRQMRILKKRLAASNQKPRGGGGHHLRRPGVHAIATTARPAAGAGATQPQSGAIPFSASSLIAFAFLARCASPIPRNTFGALENWMLS
jgi:hypothetical protein